MAPPTDQLHLDVEAISGICGSISIACWVVVFSPQIVENFRRGSAEGLSIQFIVVWLLGDVFNILGAILQGVLPTMLILAIYYTIADVVLLAQVFSYRGFTLRDTPTPPPAPKRKAHSPPTERSALLPDQPLPPSDWTHLSPAVPLVGAEVPPLPPPSTRLQSAVFNLLAVLMVCLAGVLGWWLSRTYSPSPSPTPPASDGGEVAMSFWGQVFGYLCAALYLGSRLPQLLLNYRRKSTEGVSMLFFVFACLGNATYVLSILAYEADCAGDEGCDAAGAYWRYILVNMSWIVGSAGTLVLDAAIFAQFFLYNRVEGDKEEDAEESVQGEEWDERPVLERNGSFLA